MSRGRKHRFLSPETNLTFLFSSLIILLFVIYPFEYGVLTSIAIQTFLFLVLLSGSYAAIDRPRRFHISLILAGIVLVSRIPYLPVPGKGAFVLEMGASLCFLGYTTGVVLSRVLSPGRITIHRIKGAVAVYMLLGLIWALGYVAVEVLWPGSFVQAGEILEDLSINGLSRVMVYMSFVTMTTLGYGDITPVSSIARSLTTLQALTGQFFIAVLVARLVAMEIAQRESKTGI